MTTFKNLTKACPVGSQKTKCQPSVSLRAPKVYLAAALSQCKWSETGLFIKISAAPALKQRTHSAQRVHNVIEIGIQKRIYCNFQHVIINLLNNSQELDARQESIFKFLSNPALQGSDK